MSPYQYYRLKALARSKLPSYEHPTLMSYLNLDSFSIKAIQSNGDINVMRNDIEYLFSEMKKCTDHTSSKYLKLKQIKDEQIRILALTYRDCIR